MTDYVIMHLLPDLAVGGGQVMVLRLSARLLEKGRRVMVASYGTDCAMSGQFRRAGIPVMELGLKGLHQMRMAVRELEIAIKANDISILHTHGTVHDKILGHILSSRLSVPEVTTLHGMPPTYPLRGPLRSLVRHLISRTKFELDWWLARSRLSMVVAVSDAVLEAWNPILQIIDREKHIERQVIYWGIDPKDFPILDEQLLVQLRKEMVGASESIGPLIVSVSRLHTGKNLDALPLAMKGVLNRWPTANLCIVGEGNERDALERQIADLNLENSIRLLGQRTDVPMLLAAADVSVFPSLKEGFGMVALESLAAGTPVICYELPSLRGLMADVDAIRVASDSHPESLGAEMSKALADPLLPALGRKAREIVLRSWNLDVTACAYDRLYAKLHEEGKKSGVN